MSIARPLHPVSPRLAAGILAASLSSAIAPAFAGAIGPPEFTARVDRLERAIARAENALDSITPTPIPAQWGWGQQPAQNDDSTLRLNQIEGRMRQLNGQVEQLQFQLRRIEDQMRRMQEDTEFRFQELQGQGARPNTRAQQQRPAQPAAPQPLSPRGDIAEPSTSVATAPAGVGRPVLGAPPQNLGQIALDAPTGQPLDLAAGARGTPIAPPVAADPQGARQMAAIGGGQAPAPPAGRPGGVAPPSDDPRGAYDLAYGHFLRGEYDLAQEAFQTYLASFPTDRNAGEALYWLGESYYQRRQWREAADAFLKSYTDFPQGAKAPESLLRLGMSMRQLGQAQAACASFAEVLRKYPRASAAVRQRAQSETRGAGCS